MKLEFENVSKSFNKQDALHQINLILSNFQTLVLIGPSGGGKSTLLRLISGLEKPDIGLIRIEDKPVPDQDETLREHRKSMGIVFQSWNLFPHWTALENISCPLHYVHGYPIQEAEETAHLFLKRFGLENHAYKKPFELSGGQCQRVAIVRAVAKKPKILLLDEPTSALDPLMTAEVLDLINELKEEGCCIVMASHHLRFVKKISDYVAFISDGKLVECEPTETLFSKPQSKHVKHFLELSTKY